MKGLNLGFMTYKDCKSSDQAEGTQKKNCFNEVPEPIYWPKDIS